MDFSESTQSIAEQIEKSMRRLVAEETSVARVQVRDDGSDNVIDFPEDDTVVINNDNNKKKIDKKTQYTIIAIVCSVIVFIAVIISVALINVSSTRKGYTYNYETGMEYYNDGDYETAIKYLKKASLTTEGKSDLDLKMTLYKCYYNTENYDKAIETLKDILSYDSTYADAIKALASYYYKNADGESLTELINTYKDTSCETYIKKYMVSTPTVNKAGGEYDEDISLTLSASSDCVIYYTLDGTTPTTSSNIYSNTAINLNTGTTVLKAIAVNGIGVVSDMLEEEYVLVYEKPDAPDISPVSGTYEQGQVFAITNIPDGATAYYTLDGTTPTTSSLVYTDEVELPVGNIVVSAIIVSSHDQVSSVTKRNYVITATLTYTNLEALTLLQSKLITNGVLKNSTTIANGDTAEYKYVTSTEINSVSLYIYQLNDKVTGTTIGTYGIGINTGSIYLITGSEGSYQATAM